MWIKKTHKIPWFTEICCKKGTNDSRAKTISKYLRIYELAETDDVFSSTVQKNSLKYLHYKVKNAYNNPH